MKNLAGDKNADESILKELFKVGVRIEKVEKSDGEVPCSYIGKIGKWTLRRAWYYWVATVEKPEYGLCLKKALALHNKRTGKNRPVLGKVVRSGGHCECLSPDKYGAQPIYNEELEDKLVALGYEKKYSNALKKEFVDITCGEISKLCNSGKLDVERYVDCYHIDNEIGLKEFIKFIKENMSYGI